MMTETIHSMAELMRMNIRDVLSQFPAVGGILSEAQIGCVTCRVGTCQLKDVVGIHGLSPEQEAALFARIAAEVFPGEAAEVPKPAPRPRAARRRALSPPVRELVEEHTWIQRVLALIPAVTAGEGERLSPGGQQTLREVIAFIRNFADRFHHAKEENILFTYFGDSAAVRSMNAEHEQGRMHVRAAAEGVERGDAAPAREHLPAYAALLREHIRKEDEVLYPWMDGELSDAQIGQIFALFRDVDRRFRAEPASYRAWVTDLEKKAGAAS